MALPLPVPPGAPPVGAGAPPGTPPFGPSPVSLPVPNRGLEAAALARVKVALKILEMAVPALGAETEPGRAVLDAIRSLAKHVPPGSSSPGVETTALQDLMLRQRQESPMHQVMRAMGSGAAPPAPPVPTGTPPTLAA